MLTRKTLKGTTKSSKETQPRKKVTDQKKMSEYLEQEIKKHRNLYYNESPSISDKEFDDLIENLRTVKPDSRVLKEIGASPKRNPVSLPVFLGSLENYFDDDVIKWIKKNKQKALVASEKLDGVSLCAVYKHGKLTLLTTRGDGKTGENITYKAPFLKGLPLMIDEHESVIIRGEALLIGNVPDGYKTRDRKSVV